MNLNISFSAKKQNGSISANPTTAYKNETVTLSATPASGYFFSAWDVRDASNNSITVTDNQFTMPDSDVTVGATFVSGCTVTVAEVEHGTVTASTTGGAPGTTVTLTAVPDPEDAHKATLSGTVTTSGLVAGTTTLTLLTPRESWDYIGQVGKLLLKDDAENSIEKKYHYTRATVLVTEVSGGSVRTKSAFFANEQSIYRLNFLFQAGGAGDKTPVLAKSVIISSENGHLVQSQSADGSSLEEGPVTVTLGSASSEPFFVALRNGDETNEEALGFTVIDDDGVTYKGSKTIPAQYKPNGTFLNVKNATLTGRLGLDRSAAEVKEVL